MIQKLPNVIRVWALAALAGVLFSGVAAAAGGERDPGPGHHRVGGLKRLLAGLDLSEAQRADIREIMTQNRPVGRPLLDELGSARAELRAAIAAPKLDERAIRAATERVVEAQTAVALERARTAARIRFVLTSDQRRQFDERRAQAGRHRQHGDGCSGRRSGVKRERSDDDSGSADKE